MKGLPKPLEKPSQALLGAIARAQVLGLRPDQIASVTGLTEAQIARILESEAFAKAECARQIAARLPLELLDFDELLDSALDEMHRLLTDPDTSPLTKLRIIEEIFDRDPTGALAKRARPDRPAHQRSHVFDNEAIKMVKQRAMELQSRDAEMEGAR